MELRLISDTEEREIRLIGKYKKNDLVAKAMKVEVPQEDNYAIGDIIESLGKQNKWNSILMAYLLVNVLRYNKNYDGFLGKKITREDYLENEMTRSIGKIFVKHDKEKDIIEIYEKGENINDNNRICGNC
jgi:hypothetical protein